MVKAEYKRDYYADLDLTNTADQESIKRRFRELGTWHHAVFLDFYTDCSQLSNIIPIGILVTKPMSYQSSKPFSRHMNSSLTRRKKFGTMPSAPN